MGKFCQKWKNKTRAEKFRSTEKFRKEINFGIIWFKNFFDWKLKKRVFWQNSDRNWENKTWAEKFRYIDKFKKNKCYNSVFNWKVKKAGLKSSGPWTFKKKSKFWNNLISQFLIGNYKNGLKSFGPSTN